MPYVSQEAIDLLNANPAFIANLWVNIPSFPTDLTSDANWVEQPSSPFANLPDVQAKMAFCSMMAFEMKPYGTSSAWTLADMCAAPYLSCAQYVKLAMELFNILCPFEAKNAPGNADYDPARAVVTAVGWNGNANAVGNHVQAIISLPGHPDLLCDPTAGLLAINAGYNNICQGVELASGNITEFWTRFDTIRDPAISAFVPQLKSALTGGKYKPMDALYYIPGLANFSAIGTQGRCTPQAWTYPTMRTIP